MVKRARTDFPQEDDPEGLARLLARDIYYLRTWIRSVAILALPAIEQIKWIDSLGPGAGNVYEIGQEFEDSYLLSDKFLSWGWLDIETVNSAATLAAKLETMTSAEDDLWTYRALRESGQWMEIRHIASNIVRNL